MKEHDQVGAGRWTLLVMLLAVVGSLGALAWYTLPTNDVPDDPDAVVVLGGAGGERAELGIELAERYDAELVLSSSAGVFGERQGRTCGEDAICFDPVPENTAGEAENVAAMAQDRGWGHVTVATSEFHTTRSRFLFRQCMDDAVTVVGASRDGRPSTTAPLVIREGLGILAGATVARAC